MLWVANPEETGFFVRLLLKDIAQNRLETQGDKIEELAAQAKQEKKGVLQGGCDYVKCARMRFLMPTFFLTPCITQ